jgi:hypothetical protein
LTLLSVCDISLDRPLPNDLHARCLHRGTETKAFRLRFPVRTRRRPTQLGERWYAGRCLDREASIDDRIRGETALI